MKQQTSVTMTLSLDKDVASVTSSCGCTTPKILDSRNISWIYTAPPYPRTTVEDSFTANKSVTINFKDGTNMVHRFSVTIER